ncbi:universal stress protein [Mesorhizobium sp. AR10]|uniref:universal stress protein n=1 Tax=Mesorhizobium sp. AR10 TaxID=2865839 RepID=UPI00215ED6DA|nr:universal stress protein [Mesorhizobium sp. AR10]UVK38668.1 universal stress protein [Mesorhizobium sp. AR10]
MIKVVLVRLDGTTSDEFRLAASESLVTLFDAHIVGLFLNVLPEPALAEANVSVEYWTRLLEQARQRGRDMEEDLGKRLRGIAASAELRHFDVYAEEQAGVTARECRTADVFLGLRLSEVDKTVVRDVVEEVLFESGKHLFLVADQKSFERGFEHAIIAWNRSREAARAVAEALPYLAKSRLVTIVAVEHGEPLERPAKRGEELVPYLGRHGIDASVHVANKRGLDMSSALLNVIGEQRADLVVMGGYGHSRLREWLLGGVTYKLLRKSPVSLVIAH